MKTFFLFTLLFGIAFPGKNLAQTLTYDVYVAGQPIYRSLLPKEFLFLKPNIKTAICTKPRSYKESTTKYGKAQK